MGLGDLQSRACPVGRRGWPPHTMVHSHGGPWKDAPAEAREGDGQSEPRGQRAAQVYALGEEEENKSDSCPGVAVFLKSVIF